MEPVYVDDEDVFGDNSWRYPNTFFERTVLEVTGRKYFKSEAQAKRVRAIASRSLGDAPKYPIEYLKQVVEWCRKKNRGGRPVITLDALISAIRNPDNLAKYYKGEPVVEDRSGYDDDISW